MPEVNILTLCSASLFCEQVHRMSRTPVAPHYHLIVACSLLLSGCLGDPGRVQVVELRNASGTAVTIDSGGSKEGVADARLDAGAEKRTGWLIKAVRSPAERVVRAYDESGGLIFCRPYVVSYEEAHSRPIVVVIQKGDITC